MVKEDKGIVLWTRVPVQVSKALDKMAGDEAVKSAVIQRKAIVKLLKEEGYLKKTKKYL